MKENLAQVTVTFSTNPIKFIVFNFVAFVEKFNIDINVDNAWILQLLSLHLAAVGSFRCVYSTSVVPDFIFKRRRLIQENKLFLKADTNCQNWIR